MCYLVNTCENEYYTSLEVAELLGLDKNTILQRCKKNWYDGAYKTDPTPGNPHGQWLIPKRLIDIDTAHVIRDVATLTRQINPLELERVITQAITYAVVAAIEPLNLKLDEQAVLIQEQAQIIQELQNQTMRNLEKLESVSQTEIANRNTFVEKTDEINRNISQLITESRLERERKKKKWWSFNS